MNMDKIFIHVGTLAIEFPDGHTIGLSSFHLVKSGWVVPLKGAQNIHGEHAIVEAIEIAFRTTQFISGWREGDLVFFDVVFIFEHEHEAREAAKDQEAMMIYQIETGKVVWLI